MGRRLLVADLACGLRVATVHLESMAEFAAARAAQLRIVQPYLARSPDVVLIGDMNFRDGDALEESVLDPSFVDVWPHLRPSSSGFTVDSDRNPMRLASRSTPTRKRIDRVFLRSESWRATSIELLGTEPIDDDETFVSDHFGLAFTLERDADQSAR
jgi:endonuclease/exonuclease/phosphatase family metal-dependent hydrolase